MQETVRPSTFTLYWDNTETFSNYGEIVEAPSDTAGQSIMAVNFLSDNDPNQLAATRPFLQKQSVAGA